MPSYCATCQKEIKCCADTEQACFCTKVKLTEDELLFLRERYQGCLCKQCLLSVKTIKENKT